MLQALIERAESLLHELPNADGPAVSPTGLPLAGRALQQGRPDRAVEYAHQVAAQAPDATAVFRRMIELHVAAAERTPRRRAALAAVRLWPRPVRRDDPPPPGPPLPLPGAEDEANTPRTLRATMPAL